MYQFCRYRFDPENHLLESEGSPVLLTPKAFEILVILVENGNKLTTKEQLMRKVWPDSFVEEANLTVNISALRRQLGETPSGQQYIETVPKKGYRFAVPVSQIPQSTEKAIDKDDSPIEEAVSGVASSADGSSNREIAITNAIERKRAIRSGVALVCLIAVVLSGLAYRSYRHRSNSKQSSQLPRRLAILPFQNLRPNEETDFLGFSLADATITKLGYVSELTVLPSDSVQKYKAPPIDIKRIAGELKVNTVLTGTYLRDGDNLRIACQLIDVKTEDLLWKGAFDVKYDKLLTVQDQVVQQIIRELELTLSASEAGRLKTDETVDPIAYEYYLRGVDLYSKGEFPTAVRMLEKSTELAPQFSLSWANLGKAYTANASFQLGGSEYYRKAEAAFSKALSLQPDQIDSQVYLANMFTDTGKVEKAVPLLREALKTNPNHAEVHWELSYAYRFAGMLRESVAESERARELDSSVKLNSSAQNGYLYLGQYDKFLQSLPKTDDVSFIVFYRGLGEYYQKNFLQAQADFEHAYALDNSLLQAEIGRAMSFQIQGQNGKGSKILGSLEARVNERGVVDAEALYKIAQAYVLIGDKPSALRVLNQSIENGFFPYPYFVADPLLDPLRGEEKFSELLSTARVRHERFKGTFF